MTDASIKHYHCALFSNWACHYSSPIYVINADFLSGIAGRGGRNMIVKQIMLCRNDRNYQKFGFVDVHNLYEWAEKVISELAREFWKQYMSENEHIQTLKLCYVIMPCFSCWLHCLPSCSPRYAVSTIQEICA